MIDQHDQRLLALATQFLDRYRRPLALVAGALNTSAETLLHPLIVVPLIVLVAGGPWSAAGTLATVTTTAWLLGQLLVSHAAPRGWLLAFRAGLALVIGGLALLLGGNTASFLSTMTIALAAFWTTGGILAAGQPAGLLTDPEADSAPTDLVLLLGGGLSVLVSLQLGQLLAPGGAGFPAWVAQIALVAALALALGAGLTLRPDPVAAPASFRPWRHLSLAPALLVYGRRPRRYFAFRVLVGLAMLADPLMIVIGVRAFDMPLQGVGLLLAVVVFIQLVAGMVLPTVIAAGYSRLLAQGAALLRLVIPVVALTLPMILRSGPVSSRLPTDAGWLVPAIFGSLLALQALAAAVISATDAAYLRDALAPTHRQAMRALHLIVLALLSLAFVGGGIIADRWGLETLLMVASGAGLLTLLASGLLLEVPPVDTRDLTDTGALPTFREQEDWA